MNILISVITNTNPDSPTYVLTPIKSEVALPISKLALLQLKSIRDDLNTFLGEYPFDNELTQDSHTWRTNTK